MLDHLSELIKSYQLEVEKKKSSMRLAPELRIRAATDKLNRLKDLYVDGFIDKPTFEADHTKLQQEVSAALAEKQAIHVTPAAVRDLILKADDFRTIYAAMDRQHKYDLWQSTIKSIKIDEPTPPRGCSYKKFIVDFY